MYRVELKEFYEELRRRLSHVPNVPCGVERKQPNPYEAQKAKQFLMYRVELKAMWKEKFIEDLGRS